MAFPLFFLFLLQIDHYAQRDLKKGLQLFGTEGNVGLTNAWMIVQTDVSVWRTCLTSDSPSVWYTDERRHPPHFTFVFNLQSQATLWSLLVHPCVTAQKWKCPLCRKEAGRRTRAIKCLRDDVLVKLELLPGCNKKGELKVSCRFRDSTNESCM